MSTSNKSAKKGERIELTFSEITDIDKDDVKLES